MAVLKYLIALIVIVAAWLTWWLASLPLWVPITVTSVTVFALLAWWIFSRFRGHQAAHQLEGALTDQATEQADNARPDLQAELQEIRGEFEKAVGALKSSKLGRGRRDALYILPWYVIIGPPGAGKTTALRNSGLQFPYLSAQSGRGVRGIGGTRNCDWWLTNEAVILDTAGRWSTQDEDREEWLGFLGLLKKYRKKKPLNGIIVTLSVSELAELSSDQLTELAKAIRERVDEAMSQLQMVLPVYVLFTKCDLISGFAESFGSMSKDERGVVWGFTLPIGEQTDPVTQFDEHFDKLVQALEAYSVRRLNEENRVEVRHKVFGLPQQLEELRPCFNEFIAQLFEENVFSDTPLMRGAYFASGTQEGRPFDRIMQRIGEAYSLQVNTAQEQQIDQKGYFLRDLFKKVIFPDRDLALRSEAERTRQKRMYYATVGSLFVLAGLMLTVPAYSYFTNRALIGGVEEAGEALVTQLKKDKGAMQKPEAFVPFVDELETLDEYEREGAPVRMRAGLFQGEALQGPVSEFFGQVFQTNVVRSLFEQDSLTIDEFGREFEASSDDKPSRSEYADVFDRLRRHLLLTTPKEEAEPAIEGETADALAAGIASRWSHEREIHPEDEQAQASAVRSARAYVSALGAHDTLGFRRDETNVDRTRSGLALVSKLDLIIDELVSKYEHEDRGPKVTVRWLVGGGISAVTGDGVVRRAFTKRVWDKHLREIFKGDTDGLIGDMWVLGEYAFQDVDDASNKKTYRKQLFSRYIERYIDEWRELILSVRVQAPSNSNESIQLLQDLTHGKPTPLGRMFRQIHYNIDLIERNDVADKAKSALGGALMRGVRRRVGRVGQEAGQLGDGPRKRVERGTFSTEYDLYDYFAGLSEFAVPEAPSEEGETPQKTDLDHYVEQLLFIRSALDEHIDDPSNSSLRRQLQSARSKTKGLISRQQVGWRPALEAILLPPIDGAVVSADRGRAGQAGRAWCSSVLSQFDQSFRESYPFVRRGRDLMLPDFAAFYKSGGGTLWQFYSDYLEPQVPRRGRKFEFKRSSNNERQVYTTALKRFLTRSWRTSSALFVGGEPRFDFRVRIRPSSPRVAVQVLSVGGKSYEYVNQPEQWTRMSWPGGSPDEGASIQISGEGGMRDRITQDGPWGLFRLIEKGTDTRDGQNFSVTWRLENHDVDVTIDFKPTKSASPFFGGPGKNPRLMSLFRGSDAYAPKNIVNGMTTCH